MQSSIHANTVIDPGAEIAKGVKVGPFTVIEMMSELARVPLLALMCI